jgi:hypothetical protein
MGMMTDTAVPQEFIKATTSLGNTGGGTSNTLWTFINQGWLKLASILLTYITAAASTPSLVVQIKDAAGNVLWSVAAAALTASTTNVIAVGNGLANNTGTTTQQILGLPTEMWVPPGGSIVLLVNGTAVATDTYAANIIAAQ